MALLNQQTQRGRIMNKSETFKAAHAFARQAKAQGYDYRASFGAFLRFPVTEKEMDIKESFEAHGKVWEKDSMKRVYFNDKATVAKAFNYEIVKEVCGTPSRGFDGMMTGGKTKSYYDIVNEIFYADNGEIANAARAADLTTKRIK